MNATTRTYGIALAALWVATAGCSGGSGGDGSRGAPTTPIAQPTTPKPTGRVKLAKTDGNEEIDERMFGDSMEKRAINITALPAPEVSFSRAMKVAVGGAELLFISGTASIGPNRETLHPGDFEKQARHTYKNIENILKSEGMRFSDVVKWTVFLKDMKYYDRFEKVRAAVFSEQGLTKELFPASTAVQASLCREELLIEMEAIAVKKA